MAYTTWLYLCAIFTYGNSAPDFDLKIELNETFDKQTALDKMDIAFVNKVNLNETDLVNNHITDGEFVLSAKSKQKPKNKYTEEKNDESEVKYLDSPAKNARGFESLKDNSAQANFATYKQLQPHHIKENLNSFKMTKKNSFYVTPAFQSPNINRLNEIIEDYNNLHLDNEGLKVFRVNSDNGRYHNLNFQDLDYELFGNTVFTKGDMRNLSNATNANYTHNSKRTYKEDKDKENEESDILSLLNHPEVAKILKQQTDLIVKLEKYLRTEKSAKLRSDFDDLITSIENKKDINKTIVFQDRITKKTTPQVQPSTVMTVIDQSEVRRALFQDPLVQRILKMTQRKKMEYMKNAKKHYSNMLYI